MNKLNAYRNNIKSTALASQLGCTPQNIRQSWRRLAKLWDATQRSLNGYQQNHTLTKKEKEYLKEALILIGKYQ